MSFYLKQGDLEPDIDVELADSDGAAIDLGAADTVEMRALTPTGTTWQRAMTIVSSSGGVVRYTWQAGDTDDAGVYRGEVVITWTGGEVQTFPADGCLFWTVNPTLA